MSADISWCKHIVWDPNACLWQHYPSEFRGPHDIPMSVVPVEWKKCPVCDTPRPIPVMPRMLDKLFWKIVNEIGWSKNAKSCESGYGKPFKFVHRMKKHLMRTYTLDEMERFRRTFSDKYNRLVAAISEAHVELDLGDDSFGDCVAHVVGCGKKEFEASVKNPKRMLDRVKHHDYIECVYYVIPVDDDYRQLDNIGRFIDWATKEIDRLDGNREPDMPDDVRRKIIVSLGHMTAANPQKFLEDRLMIAELLDCGRRYSNCYGILNLYNDADLYLIP